jgi:hypothetical protein
MIDLLFAKHSTIPPDTTFGLSETELRTKLAELADEGFFRVLVCRWGVQLAVQHQGRYGTLDLADEILDNAENPNDFVLLNFEYLIKKYINPETRQK